VSSFRDETYRWMNEDNLPSMQEVNELCAKNTIVPDFSTTLDLILVAYL
jgi:hypothetical protein